jgi:spermidine/putrescine transport system permease protein
MQALPSDLSDRPHARRPRVWGWVLLSPMIAWLALFVIVPMLILLFYSFCSRDDLGRVVFEFTWDNYARVFDPIYLAVLGRSVGYAALTTALCVILGYPVAWFIARQREEVRNRLLLLVMIPFWTSFLIRTYAWITILKSEGLLNGFLLSAKVIPAPLEILYTPAAVVIGLVYAYLPFMILPIYGSAEKLDNALVDAAHDLGAGPVRAFSEVIVPLTWPGIAAGVLLVFVPAIGMFAITDLMGGAKVPMIGNVIQNQFFKARNWPFGAALGVVFTLMFIVAYALLQRRGRNQA